MRRMLAFIGGVLSGGVIGAAAARLFAPTSGDTMRRSIHQRWGSAVQAGQQAAQARRQELETRLVEITGAHMTDELAPRDRRAE
ncbi:MAG: YtxH domain-containing protein [Anaerolineae bacterium]|nr:YtxH domain-containing protein [Anaerolineae bacterium]